MPAQRLYLAISFSVFSVAASADGGAGPSPARPVDPEYAQAVAAVDAKDYAKAIRLLDSYTARKPNDADAWNWRGYAQRKSGNLEAAFADYDKALKIDPEHRGAHEYLGEAYLMAGDLPRAEEQLRILDRLCWLPCGSYTDLKRAVAEYKNRPRPSPAAATN